MAGHAGQCSRILAMGYNLFPAPKLLQARSCQLRIDALGFLAFTPRFLDDNPQKLRVLAAMLLAEFWTLGPSDEQMQERCFEEES